MVVRKYSVCGSIFLHADVWRTEIYGGRGYSFGISYSHEGAYFVTPQKPWGEI